MRLVSINVAKPVEVSGTERGTVTTAIFKRPVDGPVMVRSLNVDGDAQADLVNHGGRDKAVYAYALEDYAYWAEELGRELPNHGWFGENLTIEGASSNAAHMGDEVHIGDVLSVGGAILQVTQPRIPCFKLEFKMERRFAAKFMRSGRTGFYLRVLQEGQVHAGDEISLVKRHPQAITVSELSNTRHFDDKSAEEMQQILAMDGLSDRWRDVLAQRLDPKAKQDGQP